MFRIFPVPDINIYVSLIKKGHSIYKNSLLITVFLISLNSLGCPGNNIYIYCSRIGGCICPGINRTSVNGIRIDTDFVGPVTGISGSAVDEFEKRDRLFQCLDFRLLFQYVLP